MSLCKRWVKSC